MHRALNRGKKNTISAGASAPEVLVEEVIAACRERFEVRIEEVTVTSEHFDRGWFSSEGRHRIELNDGDVRSVLDVLFQDGGYGGIPALIIDTRIDHGLVPVSSMGRAQGS